MGTRASGLRSWVINNLVERSPSRWCVCPSGANRALGIDDKAFVLVDSVLITALGRIALMPVLVLAARICPEVPPSPTAAWPDLGIKRAMFQLCGAL